MPKRGGQLRSSRSIAMVDEVEGEDGADEGCVRAKDAREVGRGCLGEGNGDAVGSVISRSLGVDGRICRAMGLRLVVAPVRQDFE